MSGNHVMAIDLGTGSARAVIFDRRGNQVAAAVREWSHLPEPGVPGSQVFTTEHNWQLICDCTREAIAKSGIAPTDVAAVSTTSMREGIVLFDADGKELWACPNVDARAGEQALAMVESGLARRIYEVAGDWVSITSPARLSWLRDNAPNILEKTAILTMLSDWALYRLSGSFVTEPSAGSSSGMFDLAQRRWSDAILDWIGLDSSILPEVVDPGSVVGTVTESASGETGLAAGTPVVAAGADTQLALVGMGPQESDSVTVIGGSFWQATSLEDRPVIDPEARLRTLCHTEPGFWMLEGIGFYVGIAMRWFRDSFCHWELAEAERKGIDPYEAMETSASNVPAGSGGMLAILSNVMDAKRWVQASPSFVQLSVDGPEPTTRAHCIRAIEESAAYVTLRHIEIIQDVVGRNIETVRFTGGASQGALWPQILADVTGRVVQVPVVKESTALGAAAYAAVGAEWSDSAMTVFPGAGSIERVFDPHQDLHQQYRGHSQRWLEVYSRMLEMSESGLLEPMWWPAGVKSPPRPSFLRQPTTI